MHAHYILLTQTTQMVYSPSGGSKKVKNDSLGTVLVTVLVCPRPAMFVGNIDDANQLTFMSLLLLNSFHCKILPFFPVYFTAASKKNYATYATHLLLRSEVFNTIVIFDIYIAQKTRIVASCSKKLYWHGN